MVRKRIVTLVAVGCLTWASPSFGQTKATTAETVVRIDARVGAQLAKRAPEGLVQLAELLGAAGSVELRGDRSMDLVLHVLVLRRGKVASHHRSRGFTARSGVRVAMSDILLSGQPEYGRFAFDPTNVVGASEAVPAAAAVEDAGAYSINGIPYRPKNWQTMDIIYVVAVPANARTAASVSARFAVVFLMPIVWGD